MDRCDSYTRLHLKAMCTCIISTEATQFRRLTMRTLLLAVVTVLFAAAGYPSLAQPDSTPP